MGIFFKNFMYKVFRYMDSKIFSKLNQFKVNSVKLGYRDKNSSLGFPSYIAGSNNVYLHEYARIQGYHIILTYTSKFVMKKYSGAAMGLTVVTGNHIPTVGIPQYLLAPSHINDKEEDVIVDEDVWIGSGVTLLAGTHICRGCIIGAKTLVNKKSECPPYAVIVGCPSKIVAAKFTIDQIIEHEKKLYSPSERFSRKELENIFDNYYRDKRTIGVDCNLTSEETNKYEILMEIMNFKYPQGNTL